MLSGSQNSADITEKFIWTEKLFEHYLNAPLRGKGKKFTSNLFSEMKAFEAKLKLWQKQFHLHQNAFKYFPCFQSALRDCKSDSGANHGYVFAKLQHNFNRRFRNFRTYERGIEVLSIPFDIDVNQCQLVFKWKLLN